MFTPQARFKHVHRRGVESGTSIREHPDDPRCHWARHAGRHFILKSQNGIGVFSILVAIFARVEVLWTYGTHVQY